ncbi:GMP synthase [glutamine-hydrolyzing] [Roseovarius litorisediminis]|uniref:GMP synthase [glutamine-hydrolyzing] n=1 Tax=Roseovarius litorisediminis TaxID=1312363 RepID=A0A1Y5RNW8_9RHOB|nr:type 1 glutamine amidotransferase [Roseovarius litorisediminis]SLN19152.1 GMP synthase [glutamine-hydrolyzing] [Roseovarius litorisediminis]
MHILVLQHERVEHPGIFRQFLAEDGHTWDAIELDEGETLPPLEGYDALWVLGGPMDVWQEDAHPWLKDEKALIREAVEEKGLPFLGLCLGHQLLAEALGGEVGKSETPEIGVLEVQLTETGATGVLFDGIPERFDALQWHSAEITKLPAGAQVLATSPACTVQAMKWGTRAFSMQFHIEIESDTVKNWADIPEYAGALETAMGKGAVAAFDAACAEQMDTFNNMAERLYINWLQATAKT